MGPGAAIDATAAASLGQLEAELVDTIGREAVARAMDFATEVPNGLTKAVILEYSLDREPRRLDVSAFIESLSRGARFGGPRGAPVVRSHLEPVRRAAQRLGERDAWLWERPIWLEWDLEPHAAPKASLFFSQPRDRCDLAAIERTCAVASGNELSAAASTALARLLAGLPAGAGLDQVGAMAQPRSDAVRLVLGGCTLAEQTRAATSAGWHTAGEVFDLAARLGVAANGRLAIGVDAAGPTERASAEVFRSRGDSASTLLARLASAGLADPDLATRAAAFAGVRAAPDGSRPWPSRLAAAREVWGGHVVCGLSWGLSHLKVTCDGGSHSAKAYLEIMEVVRARN